MSFPRNQKLYHLGIHFPWPDHKEKESKTRVISEWISDERIIRQGFCFVDEYKGNKVVAMQSVGTQEPLIMKTINSHDWRFTDDPPDLRFSTYEHADVGREDDEEAVLQHAGVRLPSPTQVDGVDRTYFLELVAWQKFCDKKNDMHYSLYFKHYNGGTLQSLMKCYRDRKIPVPEHFIWHTMLRLCLCIRFLVYGIALDSDYDRVPESDNESDADSSDDERDPNWRFVSHQDFVRNNIFIHYPPDGRGQRLNKKLNCFPDVILGDFGEACQDGDVQVPAGVYDTAEASQWQDVYNLGETLRLMAQITIPPQPPRAYQVEWKPNDLNMDRVNEFLEAAGHQPYSEELIGALSRFEYPQMQEYIIDQDLPDGRPAYEHMPSVRWIVNELIPLAKRMCRRYEVLAEQDEGYMASLDVSWTKPPRFMPLE
ncbi:hypothetical protein F5Y11DRAFT_311559 [Daldinia sp. FL1419]|nr:hypothetical protein F5Y11DRAFT_311559 [Daldinia sp. FL1419]